MTILFYNIILYEYDTKEELNLAHIARKNGKDETKANK